MAEYTGKYRFCRWRSLSLENRVRTFTGGLLKQLEQLGKVMGIEGERLLLMFPPKGEPINIRIIRLCCTCYDEAPYHWLKWPFRSTAACVRDSVASANRHQLRLLYKCPNCEQQSPIPAEWESGRCRKCQMLFRWRSLS